MVVKMGRLITAAASLVAPAVKIVITNQEIFGMVIIGAAQQVLVLAAETLVIAVAAAAAAVLLIAVTLGIGAALEAGASLLHARIDIHLTGMAGPADTVALAPVVVAAVGHLEGREEAVVVPAAVEVELMVGATIAAQRELLLPWSSRLLLNMWW